MIPAPRRKHRATGRPPGRPKGSKDSHQRKRPVHDFLESLEDPERRILEQDRRLARDIRKRRKRRIRKGPLPLEAFKRGRTFVEGLPVEVTLTMEAHPADDIDISDIPYDENHDEHGEVVRRGKSSIITVRYEVVDDSLWPSYDEVGLEEWLGAPAPASSSGRTMEQRLRELKEWAEK